MKKFIPTLVISLAVLSVCGLFIGEELYAEEEVFSPYTGLIAGDAVNIRSGPGMNFEILRKMNKGDLVLVLDETLNWYKIKLPRNSKAFVHAKFIHIDNTVYGRVMANNVNVRAGKGTHFNVIGQVDKDNMIEIFGHSRNWYQVFPAQGSFAWVNKNFVKNHSSIKTYANLEKRDKLSLELLLETEKFEKDNKNAAMENGSFALIIAKYKAILQRYPESPAVKRAQSHIAQLKKTKLPKRKIKKRRKKTSEKDTQISSLPKGEPTAQGKLLETGRFFNRPGSHKLVEGKKTKYFLKSSKLDLNKFVRYQVKIWGKVKKVKRTKIPVIEVDSIKKIKLR